jgi:hypothetical protein
MYSFDMSSSDAEDLRWELHKERIKTKKRKQQLVEAFTSINPSSEETHEAWLEYQKAVSGD